MDNRAEFLNTIQI